MNPRLLLCPNIPKPLHGIAPRVVLGKAWWDKERNTAYEQACFKCECCATPKAKAWPHPWLEAHELYDYDYEHGHLTFRGLAVLCPACHMFIHSGRLLLLLDSGRITSQMYEAIHDHGYKIIEAAHLETEYVNRHNHKTHVKWTDWRMVINGKSYGPSSSSQIAWARGEWRFWTPQEESMTRH